MNKGKRGWSQSNLSKPAADIDIRYGHNLLKTGERDLALIRRCLNTKRL